MFWISYSLHSVDYIFYIAEDFQCMLGSTLLSLSVKKVQFLIRARERLNWIEAEAAFISWSTAIPNWSNLWTNRDFLFFGVKIDQGVFQGF